MTPKIAQRGASFKGASQYYLHDKRGAGEESRTTSERVAWTKTRNISSDNAAFAFRIMAATAMDKDRLKEQAGVKNTGNKSKGEVYSYSLAWHPEETGKFTKSDMLKAADQSLKALGAQDHQAVIIAHQDTAHPHIHVVVNMVHPDTGKNLNISNDRNKLDKWANIYRKERGEDHKYNPNRAKKYDAIEDKKRGVVVDFIAGENIPRGLREDFAKVKKLVNKNDYRQFRQRIKQQFEAEKIRVTVDRKEKNLNLSQFGFYQKVKHYQEQHILKTEYADKKKQISKDYFAEKKRATDAIKEQMNPAIAEAYKQSRAQAKFWDKRDKNLIGKLQNAIEAVKFTNEQGRGENKHFIRSLFNALSKIGYREQALKNVLNKQLNGIRSTEEKQISDSISKLNKNRRICLLSAKKNFVFKVQLLKDAQKTEQGELKGRWQRLNDRRKKAVESLILKTRVAPTEEAISRNFKITVRKQFKESSKRRRTRSRKNDHDKGR